MPVTAVEYLGIEVRVLSNSMHKTLNQMTLETEGLTVHQCWILQHLAEHQQQEVRQKDIEELFSIRRSTANDMLRILEKKQYLERRTAPSDARANILVITETGLQANERVHQCMVRFVDMFHKDIPAHELESFRLTLRKLCANLNPQ